jgi:5-methylcytosine-specific restriction protein A
MYCAEHQDLEQAYQRERDKSRKSSTGRGYSSRWQRARKSYLANHPLCVECKANGKLVTATVVDHIQPHKGNQKLLWDTSNWQPLCKPCHDRKTGTHDTQHGKRNEYKYK